jgi:hypothetical protein
MVKPTEIKYFKSKYDRMKGTSYGELIGKAHSIVNSYNNNPRRKENIRSKYFNGDKIFFEYFWQHHSYKPMADRIRRIVFFTAAIDLLMNTRYSPNIEPSKKNKSEIWYTFYGETKSGEKFAVHLKKNQRGNKYLMSVFPI